MKGMYAVGLNYLYADTLGFMGGVSVLWDTSKVFLYGFQNDAHHVSFLVMVKEMCQFLCTLSNEFPLRIPTR